MVDLNLWQWIVVGVAAWYLLLAPVVVSVVCAMAEDPGPDDSGLVVVWLFSPLIAPPVFGVLFVCCLVAFYDDLWVRIRGSE